MMTFKRKKFGTMPSPKERDERKRLDEELAEALRIRGPWSDFNRAYDQERETTEELR